MRPYLLYFLTGLLLVSGAPASGQRSFRWFGGGKRATTAGRPQGPSAALNRVEYFLDTDPGQGAATNVPITSATDLPSLAFTAPLGGLDRGVHQIGVRSRDADGKWSITAHRTFFYESLTLAGNINRVEYFLDTDPGMGAGTNVTITAAADLPNVAFTVPLASLNQGFHRLYVRSRDVAGKWSISALHQFFYLPPAATAAGNINKVEYFLDTDPGVGLGTNVPVTAGQNLPAVAFTVPLGALNQGFHRLFVRSRDANNKWSLSALYQFFYQPPVATAAGNINKLEYFLDTDPGVGSATNVPVTAAPNLPNVGFTVPLGALNQGFHRLFVRSRDANNKWSLSALYQFFYQPPVATANGNVDKVEYFLDADPGVGSATNVPITAGLNLPSVGFAVPLGSVSKGVHRLFIRSREVNGRWSETANRVFFYENVPALANINKMESYFDADPGFGNGDDVPVTTPAPNLASFPFLADIGPLSPGTHQFFLRSRDANGKWSLTATATFVRPATTGPAITTFSPTVGTGNTLVTITGTNFLGATSVTFNGTAGTNLTVVSGTQITVRAPVGGTTGVVCVVAPAGTGCSTAANRFTYVPLVTSVSAGTLCTEGPVSIAFTATGYSTGNLFTAQLSNSSGTFTSGVQALGTLSGATGGTINGTIPAGTASGSAYRIRVVGDNPAAIGADNGLNLTIFNMTTVAATGPGTVQAGTAIALNVTNPPTGATYAWTGPGTFDNAAIRNPTVTNAPAGATHTYQVVVTAPNTCQVTRTVQVVVNSVITIALGTITPTTYCAGTSITVPYTVAGGPPTTGNVFTLQLSDASGSFATATSLGTTASTASGTFTRTIPAGTATGTGYRVRVTGSQGGAISNESADLTITAPFTVAAVASPGFLLAGNTLNLSATGAPTGATYAWTGPNAFAYASATPSIPSATTAATGTYSLTVTKGACTSSSTVNVTVADCSTNLAAAGPGVTYVDATAQSLYNGGNYPLGFNGTPAGLRVTLAQPSTVGQVTYTITRSADATSTPLVDVQLFTGSTFFTVHQINLLDLPVNTAVTLTNSFAQVAGVTQVRLFRTGRGTITLSNARVGTCTGPYISSFTPTAGPAGTSVTLTGAGLTGTTAVAFAGANLALGATPAPGHSVNAGGTQITVNAPAGGERGLIEVTTPSGVIYTNSAYAYPLAATASTLPTNAYCTGSAISIPYTVTGGSFTAGNIFTAQLLDSLGNNYGTIGTRTATTAGTITGTIPAAPYGTHYNIRINASNPAQTGAAGTQDLTIFNLTGATVSSNSPVTVGGTVQLSLGTASVPAAALNTYAWTGPNGFSSSLQNPTIPNAQLAASGTYSLTISRGGCSVNRSLSVTVEPAITGLFGNTVQMNGSTDYIDLGASTALNPGASDFTVETWFKVGAFPTGTNQAYLINKGVPPPAGTTGGYFLMLSAPNTLSFYTANFNSLQAVSTAGLSAGTWYHVACVRQGNQITMYLNGRPVDINTTTNSAIDVTNTNRLTLGAINRLPTSNSRGSFYNGLLDDVRLWTVARTAAQVRADLNHELAGTETGLRAYYDMNRNGAGAGLTVADKTGNGLGGTTVGTVSTPIFTPANNNGVTLTPLISTGTVANATYCAGDQITVPYTVTGGSFPAGNVFTAELSNAGGLGQRYSSSTVLGTQAGTGSGSLTVTIPLTVSTSTQYFVRVLASTPYTVGTDDNTPFEIVNLSGVTANSNSPVATGATLALTVANAPTGSTFAWTGPAGTTITNASTAAASVTNATTANSGTYQVVATLNGCSVTRTVNVVVNPAPGTITSVGPISPTTYCTGTAISVPFTVSSALSNGNVFTAQLVDSLGTVLGTIGTLTATGSGTITGTVPASAFYSTRHRVQVITSTTAQTNAVSADDLTVINLNPATATSNSPVATGGTIQLDVTVPAASLNTYAWSKISGGGTFSSSLRNPTIAGATTANSGTYQVVVSRGGCSLTRTVSVTVNPAPGTIAGVGPVTPTDFCAGTAISIPYTISGAFTGGNVFTAQLSNASGSFAAPVTLGTLTSTTAGTISGTVPSGTATGTGYRVRVISSNPASTGPDNGADLAITAPFTATATANSQFLAAGNDLTLGVTGAPSGTTYAWTGPNAFTSASATPTIAMATAAATGTYSVTVTKGSCASTATIFVRVYACSAATANVGAGLPAANYSQIGLYQTNTSQSAWNGGGWNAGGFSGSMNVDLGAAVTLTHLELTPSPNPASSVTIAVQTSPDMNSWTTVRTITGNFAIGAPASNRRYLSFGAAPLTNVRGIRLVANYGSSWVSIQDVRAYVCPLPYITSFTPASGPNGTSVALTGGNFTGATGVAFNGTSAPGFVVNSDNSITVNAPVGGSTGLISVTNPSGTGYSTTNYTYTVSTAVATISPTTYCAGASISVPFTVTGGAYVGGNVFTAQLVDSLGAVLGTIGTLTGTTGGTISGTIPASAPYSLADRIRIVSSNPATTSAVSATNLTIIQLNPATATSNSPVATGGTIQLDATAPAASLNTYTWSKISGGGTFSSSLRNPQIPAATVANSGTYQVVVSRGSCSVTRTVSVTVDPPVVTHSITTSPLTGTAFCAGDAVTINFTTVGTYVSPAPFVAGNTFTAALINPATSAVIATIGSLNQGGAGTSRSLTGTWPTGVGTGPFRVRVSSDQPGVTGTDNGTNLTLTDVVSAVAASNSPVALGGTITLSVTGAPAGSSYAWTGPGTIVGASTANASVTNAQPASVGTYQVVISKDGCSTTKTVNVDFTTAIYTDALVGTAFCAGDPITINFRSTGTYAAPAPFVAGNTFYARLVNLGTGAVVGTIGTLNQGGQIFNRSISGTWPAVGSGSYRVRVDSDNPGATGSTNGTDLTLTDVVSAVAASNSPVAAGSTLTLSVSGAPAGSTYAWTGPGTITAANTASASVTNAQIGASGTYQVSISRNGCTTVKTVTTVITPSASVITTGSLAQLTYCAGAAISVPFTVSGGAFNTGNVFTAQLLDSLGTVIGTIGTLTQTGGGTISGNIPTGAPYSVQDRIRVVGSNPNTLGSSNGQNLTIIQLGGATASSNAPLTAGATLTFDVTGVPAASLNTYAWSKISGGGTFSSALRNPTIAASTVANSGTYQVVISRGGCSVTRTVSVTVNPAAPTASITTTGPASGTYCAGSPIYVDFTTTGTFAANNVFTAQLSDASGSFTSPVTIGTVNGPGTGSGQIGGPIPAGTPTGTGYRVRVISSNPGLIGTTSGPLTISGTSFTWVGTANANWNDPANWSCGVVPGQNDDVTINPGGNAPVVGTGGGIVRSITINLNATFTVNSTFTVYGNVVNNGTIGAGSGSGWVWAGTGGNWTVGGTGTYNFWNITVNNTVNLTVNQTITVRGNVLNNGALAQGYPYFLYLPGTSSFGGNPMTWGTYYVQPGGAVSWNTGLTAWGIYNGGSINPGTSGFTFGAGGGTAGSIGGAGSNTIPFYAVTFNNPAGVNQLSDLSVSQFWTNNYVFNPGTRQVRFTGPGTLISGVNTVFYDLVIDVTADVTLNIGITIRGDLINNGGFHCGTHGVIFDGVVPQIIGGSVVTNFYHVTFNNTVNLTLNQHIVVDGNWLNTGNFVGLGYYVLFSGTGAQTVGGAGSTRFGDVRWNNAAGVTLTSPIRVGGNFGYLGGSWNAGGFGVTFDGTATQAINGPNVPIFAGLINNNTSVTGLTLGVNVRGTGNWSGTGRYCGCGFETWFSGTAQTLGGPGRWDFHHVRITSSTSLTLNVDIHVYGDWFLNGIFLPNGYIVYFDGTVGQFIGGPVVTNFYHLVINNVVNVTLNQTIRVRGNFSGPGRFLGDGWFTIFDGSAAQTISTGGGTRFGHLTFANAAGVTLGSGIGLTGNFLNTAGFGAGGFTTGFYGTGTQTISGSGIVFGNAYTAPGATASLNVPVSFTGNLTNDGAWLANLHACTFTGTGTIGGANVPLFYHLYVNGTVTLAVNIHLTGDIRLNGVFLPATYGCIFGGTVPQRIYGTALIFNFWDLTVNTNAVVNVDVDCHIRHDLVNNGTLNWPVCRVVYFDGSTLQTIGGTTVTRFCGINVNNPGGTVRLGNNIRCTGDFRDNGGWLAGGFLTTFDGNASQGLYGLAGGGTSFGGLTFNNGSAGGVTLFGPIGLTGDFRNTAGFNAGGYGVTFGGAVGSTQQIYGPSPVLFHHLTIGLTATVNLNLDIRLTGDWTNNNVFLPNGWTVWFIGTAAQFINGPAVTNFYHLTVTNTVGLSLNQAIRIRGNFLDNGAFCGCGYLTTFDGTAPQTITCNSGNTRFHDLTFANNTGVTLLGAIGVTGNWLNNGGFNAGGQLVLFAGTGGQTIGGSALTTFHGWHNTNNSAAGVSLIRDAAWTGNWLNDGRFCGCGFGASFVGTTPQTITCHTLQSAFHHITLSNTSTGGVTLGGDIGVTGNWLVTNLFFPATYTVHFTGTALQTIVRAGAMAHCQFYGIRITNTVGVNLGANCPLYFSGPFTNNGVFGYNGNGVWANGGTGGNGSGGNGAGGHLGGGGNAAGGGGGSGTGFGSAQACGGTSPTTFGDWTLQNPTGATCAGPGGFGIQHVLTLQTGSGNLACGNAVTLLSNPTGTGMIVNQPGGGVCTGLGTMIRYITAGGPNAIRNPGYRHYASPMQLGTATVNELADDLPAFFLTQAYNTAANPFAVTPFPTVFRYDETRLTPAHNTFDWGWKVPNGATEPMTPGVGYSAMTNANTVVDITGTFQNGNVTTQPLTRGTEPKSGWNAVGNPYPAPIDWNLISKPATVDNALYIFKPTGRYSGTYASFVNNVPQNGGSKDIAAMQGFLVRVNTPGATASFNFTNAARATTYTDPAFFRAPVWVENRPTIRLHVTDPATTKADETVVYFEAGASRDFDRDYDAGKPLGAATAGYPVLWSESGVHTFGINGLDVNELTAGTVIPLGVRVPQDGAFTLTASALLHLPAGTPVWLEDRKLNRAQDLALDSTYQFTMAAADRGARFFLHLGRPGGVTGTPPETALTAEQVAVFPNPAQAELTVRLGGISARLGRVAAVLFDALGQPVRTTTLTPDAGGRAAVTLDVATLAQGVYTLRLTPQNGPARTQKVVLAR